MGNSYSGRAGNQERLRTICKHILRPIDCLFPKLDGDRPGPRQFSLFFRFARFSGQSREVQANLREPQRILADNDGNVITFSLYIYVST